jgi:glycosyltransferase involved in cell wall biosynthesis
MKVLIATDAWHPQVNGVVNTYTQLVRHAGHADLSLTFVTPEGFRCVPLPTYNEIRLALIRTRHVAQAIDRAKPDFIHVATEGPIGLAARRLLKRERRPFTTSYHTRFPEYISARMPLPLSWGYSFERWFHNAGIGVMAATQSLRDDLESQGIKRTFLWSRGVDTELFHPGRARDLTLPRPIFLYVGRVAVEKNVEAFLKLNLPGTKLVVGGGPQLAELRARFPDAVFTGSKFGEELASYYAAADVFVFPSLTDTFGNVVLEALASGVPVAAFPVTGPKDIITDEAIGRLSDDLENAALEALTCDRAACREFAAGFSWGACAIRFREIIAAAHDDRLKS